MGSRTADEVGPITSLMRLIFKNILMHICLSLGLIGNIITLIVLLEKRMRRASTTQYLAALTLFDSIYLICSFGNNIEINYPNTQYMDINPYLNLILYPLADFSSTTSVYLILMFTIERYLVVAYPLHSRSWCHPSRARKIIGITIIFCFLFTFPTFLENKIEFVWDASMNKTVPQLTETSLYPNFVLYKLIYFWLIAVIVQFIPITILIILNSILMKFIHNSMTNKNNSITIEENVSDQKNLSNSMILIKNDEDRISINNNNNNLNENVYDFNVSNKTTQKLNSGKCFSKKMSSSSPTNSFSGRLAVVRNSNNNNNNNNNMKGDFANSTKALIKQNNLISLNPKKSNASSIKLRCNMTLQQSEQNKATLLLIATVLVFLICQLPSALLLIYEAIFPLKSIKSKMSKDIILGLNNIANGLGAINASINFILYSCFSEKFRQTFQRIFLCRKKSPPKNYYYNNYNTNNKDNNSTNDRITINRAARLSNAMNDLN